MEDLLLSYIKSHVEVYNSTEEVLKEFGGLMLMFLKVTLHVQPLPQKHVYQVFQWMIYSVEGHGQMNLPDKNFIINKCFQISNFSGRATRVVW